MSILIGALEFEGPFLDFDSLSDEPGIYAVLCEIQGEFELVELGDSEQVRECLIHHPERDSWHDNCPALAVAVHYTADITTNERHEIRENLEQNFDLECAA